MVLWMCDDAARRTRVNERREWYEAALRGKRGLSELLDGWGIRHQPWYGDNTREPLRDETFRSWAEYGAVIRDETVPPRRPSRSGRSPLTSPRSSTLSCEASRSSKRS